MCIPKYRFHFKSIDTFRTTDMLKSKNPKVLTFDDQRKVITALPNVTAIVNGTPLSIKDAKGKIKTIMSTYGMKRLMQLRYMSPLKHHCPSTTFNSI